MAIEAVVKEMRANTRRLLLFMSILHALRGHSGRVAPSMLDMNQRPKRQHSDEQAATAYAGTTSLD
jgi:hypothetical protein